ncbi:hypothetical protein D3C85_1572020 [compost metagenome]
MKGLEGSLVDIFTQIGCCTDIGGKIGIKPFCHRFHHVIGIRVGGEVLSRRQHQVGFAAAVFCPRQKMKFNLSVDFFLDYVVELCLRQFLHPV